MTVTVTVTIELVKSIWFVLICSSMCKLLWFCVACNFKELIVFLCDKKTIAIAKALLQRVHLSSTFLHSTLTQALAPDSVVDAGEQARGAGHALARGGVVAVEHAVADAVDGLVGAGLAVVVEGVPSTPAVPSQLATQYVLLLHL